MSDSDDWTDSTNDSQVSTENTTWEKEYSEWIEDNICQRKCFHYSRYDDDYDSDTDECICGVKRQNHEVSWTSLPNWRKEFNTKTVPATFYGTWAEHIKFIRLDDETDSATLNRLLFEKWSLPKPKWIISMVGTRSNRFFDQLCESLGDLVKELPSDVMILWGMFEESVEDIQRVLSKIKSHHRITSVIFYPWALLLNNYILGDIPPLHLAVRTNNLSNVQDMLNYDVDPDQIDKFGRSALHIAAGKGFKDIIHALIKGGADVNDCDFDGFKLLDYAVYGQQTDIAKTFLKLVYQDAENEYCLTLLHIAVHEEYLEGIELLTEDNEVDKCTSFGHTPLHIAASKGFHESVKTLVKKGADTNAEDNKRITPLHLAVYGEHEEAMNALLDGGAIMKQTLMHIAAKKGSNRIVKALWKKKADVNSKEQFGVTPLHIATFGEHEDTIKSLLRRGAEINAVGEKDGRTPLHVAAQRGCKDIVKLLLSKKADVNAKANHGETPLHIAVGRGCKETVELLLQKASVNATDQNRVTPLHIAVFNNNVQFVKCLVNKSAGINMKAANGKTPLQMANKPGRERVANVLKTARRAKPASDVHSGGSVEDTGDDVMVSPSDEDGDGYEEDTTIFHYADVVDINSLFVDIQDSQEKINIYGDLLKKLGADEEEKSDDDADGQEEEDVNVLFLDNGSADYWAVGRSMLTYHANLARSLATPDDESSSSSDVIPTVALAFGGESNFFKIIQNVISCQIPVVLIKSSGGASDDLIKLLEETVQRNGVHDSHTSNTSIENVWSILESEDVSEVQVCHQLLAKRDFLNISSETNKKNALYDAVLSAIVRAKDEEYLVMFASTYINSRVSESFWHLFDDKNKKTDGHRKKILKDILFKAIIYNKIQCVEFTFDWVGGDINAAELYLKTKTDLTSEASEIFNDFESHVDKICAPSSQQNEGTTDANNVKSKESTIAMTKDNEADEEHMNKEDQEVDAESMNRELHTFRYQVLNEFLPPGCLTGIDTGPKVSATENKMSNRKGRPIYQDLFLWAVLTKRREVATVFWTRSEDLIVSALVAATIMDKFGKLTYHNKQKKAREADACYFRHLLVTTLDLCFGSDMEQTFNILDNVCEQNCWGTDFFKLALHEDNKQLFQSNCISHYIDIKWMGRLPAKASTWRILLCAIVPPLLKPVLKTQHAPKKGISTGDLEVLIQMNQLSSDAKVRSTTFKTHLEKKLNVSLKWKQLETLSRKKNEECCDLKKRLEGSYKAEEGSVGEVRYRVSPGIIEQQLERTIAKFSKSLGSKRLSRQEFRKKLEGHLNLRLTEKEFLNYIDTVPHDQNDDIKGVELLQKLQIKQKGISIEDLFDAPVVKYIYNLGSFLIFLALYAYLLLIALKPTFTMEIEIFILMWIASFAVEEVYQFVDFLPQGKDRKHEIQEKTQKHGNGRKKLSLWSSIGLFFDDYWNILDIICIISFCIGYPMVHVATTAAVYEYGRLILCLNFMCFFWRLFQAFTPSKTIGPMLYMMFRMVTDLIPFLVILFSTLASYAIATEALLFSDGTLSLDFIYQVPRRAYWQMFGELHLEEIEDNCTQPGCPSEIGRTWVPILLGGYMLITNVLLLNLLIAKINSIFQKVQIASKEVWAWQTYRLMNEYADRSKVPLPFTLFVRVLGIFRICGRKNAIGNKDDNYTITARVGDKCGAGKTDSISLTLHSELGKTWKETLKLKDKTQDVLEKKLPTDNPVEISFEQKKGAKPWYLVSVQITHNDSGAKHHVIHNDWIFEEKHTLKLKKGSVHDNKIENVQLRNYCIDISGSPAVTIHWANLKLFGKRGESGTKDIPLDRNGQTIRINTESTNIGSLSKVEIYQDKGKASWIESIDVVDTSENQTRTYRFSNKKTTPGNSVSILPDITFTVKVTTGKDTKGDLSLEQVKLQLIGESGEETEKFNLNDLRVQAPKFQKGETNEFLIRSIHTWEPKYVKLFVSESLKDENKAWFLESLTLESPSLGESLVFVHGDCIYGETTLARKEYDYTITATGYQKGTSLTWSLLLKGRGWTVGPIPMGLEKGKMKKTVKAPETKDMEINITTKSEHNEEFHMDVSVKCESDTNTWEFKRSGDLYRRPKKCIDLTPFRTTSKELANWSHTVSYPESDAYTSDNSDEFSYDDGVFFSSYDDFRNHMRYKCKETKQRNMSEKQRERQRQSLIDFERRHGSCAILELKDKEKEINLN